MIIPITDDYRISSDAHCWTVEKRRIFGDDSKTPGKVEWNAITWHPTLESAGESVCDSLCRDIDAEGYKAVIVEIQRLKQLVKEALTV